MAPVRALPGRRGTARAARRAPRPAGRRCARPSPPHDGGHYRLRREARWLDPRRADRIARDGREQAFVAIAADCDARGARRARRVAARRRASDRRACSCARSPRATRRCSRRASPTWPTCRSRVSPAWLREPRGQGFAALYARAGPARASRCPPSASPPIARARPRRRARRQLRADDADAARHRGARRSRARRRSRRCSGGSPARARATTRANSRPGSRSPREAEAAPVGASRREAPPVLLLNVEPGNENFAPPVELDLAPPSPSPSPPETAWRRALPGAYLSPGPRRPEGAIMTIMPPLMSRDDLADLAEAMRMLEGESFAMRLMRLFGGQVRCLGRALPEYARKAIALATDTALKTALRVALRSLKVGAGPEAAQPPASGRRRRDRRARRRLRHRRHRRRASGLDDDPAALHRRDRARERRGSRRARSRLRLPQRARASAASARKARPRAKPLLRDARAACARSRRRQFHAAEAGAGGGAVADADALSVAARRRGSASPSPRSWRPRRFRSSARSAGRRSTPLSPSISRRWRAAISPCGGWSASMAPRW